MAAALGADEAEKRHPEEREVADDVEYLVADELVGAAQGLLVEHPVGREHDGVVERAAADEVGAPERLDLLGEAEGAGRGNLAGEAFGVERVEAVVLAADERVPEVDRAVYLAALEGLDRDAALALLDRDAPAHAQGPPRGGLLDHTGALDHLREGVGRAVHDGQFEVVNFA